MCQHHNKSEKMFIFKARNKNIDNSQRKDLRKFKRINLKAIIIIKDIENKITARGKCINASLEGIELTLPFYMKKILSLNNILNISLVLSDGQNPIHKKGRIVWCKKATLLTYKSGIEFK